MYPPIHAFWVHWNCPTRRTAELPATNMTTQLSYGFCCPNISTCIFNKCPGRRQQPLIEVKSKLICMEVARSWLAGRETEAKAFDKLDFSFRFEFRFECRYKEHASFSRTKGGRIQRRFRWCDSSWKINNNGTHWFDRELGPALDGWDGRNGTGRSEAKRDSRRTSPGQDSWQHLSFDWQEGESRVLGNGRWKARLSCGPGETGQLAERNSSRRSGWNEAEALNASLSAWINKPRDTWRHCYLRSVHQPPIPFAQAIRNPLAIPASPHPWSTHVNNLMDEKSNWPKAYIVSKLCGWGLEVDIFTKVKGTLGDSSIKKVSLNYILILQVFQLLSA